jgi:iron complex outermembrane receptor protein
VRRLLAGAALALLAPASAIAQGDIVVTGRGLPLAPGVPAYGAVLVDGKRLQDVGRLETALLDVAGFQQFRRSDSRSANPSAQGATLRALGGNATSRTLVTLDGVPVADPFFGYVPWSALAPGGLAAARVTRGGGSGAFAAGAVAGAIELASAGRADLPDLALSAEAGSHGATLLEGGVAADLGGGLAHLSGRWDRADGFRTTPEEQEVPATVPAAYDGFSLGGRAVVPLGDTELQGRALVFRDDRTLRFEGADSRSEGADASLRLVHRGAWAAEALAYVQMRNFANRVISATTFRPTLDQRATPSTGLGGKIELRPPVGEAHLLRLGADLRLADGETLETAFNAVTGAVTARRRAGGRQSVVGLFVEDDWTLGTLVLTGGLRLDRWTQRDGRFESRNAAGAVTLDRRFEDRAGTEVSGRAGLLWRPDQGAIALRAAAYRNFRLPTLNELYRPFVVFPVTTEANASLAPERLEGVEAGVDYAPLPSLRLSATLFENRLADAIANVTVRPNLRRRENVEAIRARGLELSGNVAAGDFDLGASLAWTHSRVRAPDTPLDGLRPAQTPEIAAAATLGWQPASGTRLSATLRHTGAQYEDDLETDLLPAATVVDLAGRVELVRGVALTGRIENLFDARVVTRNAGGSVDLGAPLGVMLGLRVER